MTPILALQGSKYGAKIMKLYKRYKTNKAKENYRGIITGKFTLSSHQIDFVFIIEICGLIDMCI